MRLGSGRGMEVASLSRLMIAYMGECGAQTGTVVQESGLSLTGQFCFE